ncbi:MAG: rhomboid family intramembrane serine protease [Proteobacteria bacterium]|nr:rhomboid family intramembrane serine protease [Pseudomonadota bacterium]
MRPQRRRFDFSELKITRGALIIAALEIGLSLVWLLANADARLSIQHYVAATPENVWQHGRVWTLATSPFLEIDFIGLILHVMVLWMFVPTLERFWGTPRFYRFAIITSVVGTTIGTLVGFLIGDATAASAIVGLNPFIYASIVAFGITYARQPVQFFGVLPLTGRQLMYGFIGFLVLFVGLQRLWAQGAAFAAAMLVAALLVSKGSPLLAYRRWKARRARVQLTVLQGGQTGGSGPFSSRKKPKDDYLN